jgi:ABC-type bacteriocin/lantibiotic exporter with double-glycine peptidase domain
MLLCLLNLGDPNRNNARIDQQGYLTVCAGCAKVLIDGVDIRRRDLQLLRSQMALVSQDPVMFTTSIFDNIAMGKPGASVEEVHAAAVAANAHE